MMSFTLAAARLHESVSDHIDHATNLRSSYGIPEAQKTKSDPEKVSEFRAT